MRPGQAGRGTLRAPWGKGFRARRAGVDSALVAIGFRSHARRPGGLHMSAHSTQHASPSPEALARLGERVRDFETVLLVRTDQLLRTGEALDPQLRADLQLLRQRLKGLSLELEPLLTRLGSLDGAANAQ